MLRGTETTMKTAKQILEEMDQARNVEEIAKREATSLPGKFYDEVRHLLRSGMAGDASTNSIFATALHNMSAHYGPIDRNLGRA